MFLVNTLVLDGGSAPGWLLFLEGAAMILFLLTVWMLSWKLGSTNNPDVRFGCLAGLYGCYILGAAVLFVCIAPGVAAGLVERGVIVAEDAALYTAFIISLVFAVWNILGLGTVCAWHFKKKRSELSEMDRMKLEDM